MVLYETFFGIGPNGDSCALFDLADFLFDKLRLLVLAELTDLIFADLTLTVVVLLNFFGLAVALTGVRFFCVDCDR